MKNKYTLVVIDMQDQFFASRSQLVRDNCKKEIIDAKNKGNNIIFVEYQQCGRTINPLLKLAKGYKKSLVILKRRPDGSHEVSEAITHHNLPRRVRVCGVNTDACVQRTVLGLSLNYFIDEIEVVKDACNSDYYHGNYNGINAMRAFDKVKIV